MKDELSEITSTCPYLVCGICRTKVGWPHQRWCNKREKTELSCFDCFYLNTGDEVCAHPVFKGGKKDRDEKNQSDI